MLKRAGFKIASCVGEHLTNFMPESLMGKSDFLKLISFNAL